MMSSCWASRFNNVNQRVTVRVMQKEKSITVFHGDNTLTIKFPSRVEVINHVEDETRGFLERMGLSHEAFAVCLVMREGLTNAVKHGNRCDPAKNVTYTVKCSDNTLVIEIEDEGEGFDWRAIPEPEGDNINSDHGRGIIIMKRYMNEHRYNDKGNKLILIKHFSPDPKLSESEDEEKGNG